MTKILLIGASPGLREQVEAALDPDMAELDHVTIDQDPLATVERERPEVVLVDRKIGGAQVPPLLGRLRAAVDDPLIVLNVDNRKAEKLSMLDAGADDYVARPLDKDLLHRRVRAALGYRIRPVHTEPLKIDGLEVDFDAREVRRDGEDVHLTPTEFNLLAELAARPGGLLTHSQLLRRVWGPAYGTESHYLRVYVAQLRRKLGDDATQPRLIVTEPGIGYRWIGGLS